MIINESNSSNLKISLLSKVDDFKNVKQLLIKELKETTLIDKISIGILGSYTGDEIIYEWPELDILIFHNKRKIPLIILKKLREINITLSKNFQNISIIFKVYSLDEFPEYKQFESSICSYSLFSYLKDIEFIFGKNLIPLMKKIIKTISISTVIYDLRAKLLSSRHGFRSLISSSNVFQSFHRYRKIKKMIIII